MGYWGAGGIRELTLDANKLEQVLKYRKVSFAESVSTAFVAHCSYGCTPLGYTGSLESTKEA